MTKDEVLKLALEALEPRPGMPNPEYESLTQCAITAIKEALAQPQQEPVAWVHNLIDDNIITHRPADIDRHPDRWTALYPEPKPCPTCVALARTVMMDQTGYDTSPPARKPLTDDEISDIAINNPPMVHEFARAIEAAHGIKENT